MAQGALPSRYAGVFNPEDLIRIVPELTGHWAAVVAILDRLPRPPFGFTLSDAVDLSNEVTDALDLGDVSDEAFTAQAQALVSPLSAWYAAVLDRTGMAIHLVWAPEAEDSYAERSDEWVWLMDNYFKPREVTQSAQALITAGLAFEEVSWTVYG